MIEHKHYNKNVEIALTFPPTPEQVEQQKLNKRQKELNEKQEKLIEELKKLVEDKKKGK